MTQGARLNVAGAVLNRWQMDESSGVLRVISQQGAGLTGNGTAMPSVDTFTIASTSSFVPLGHAALTLPSQEGLRTVRFDATRAYAITFNQTDPLFSIDLSDPANPRQRGQLSMPGWMFYLEPHGDRVIGLGVDRTDTAGSLNVSLFDVSNMDAPMLLKRVAFGATGLGEDFEILNYEVPEDQDRIQKAFKVFPDGTVAAPFSGLMSSPKCDQTGGGVQLLTWANDTLTKGALLAMKGNPRRAFEKGDELIAVSDSNVTSFALASASASGSPPASSADVTIGACVARSLPGGGMEGEGADYGYRGASSSGCE
jgi:hypothetical protein